jgi:hypothetical protein
MMQLKSSYEMFTDSLVTMATDCDENKVIHTGYNKADGVFGVWCKKDISTWYL